VPIEPSDAIIITFPHEIDPPQSTNMKCLGFGVLSPVLSCTLAGSSITFPFDGLDLPIGTIIDFQIETSKNPESMKPSSDFELKIVNSLYTKA